MSSAPPSTAPGRPRLVATDLDGTLLRTDGSLSPRTVEALGAAEAAGIHVVFVTARPPRWLDALADAVAGHGTVICGNGAFVYAVGSRTVTEVHGFDPAVALSAEIEALVAAEVNPALLTVHGSAGDDNEPLRDADLRPVRVPGQVWLFRCGAGGYSSDTSTRPHRTTTTHERAQG